MRVKIEKGEFVDLEKLLLLGKFNQHLSSDSRMELVNRDWMTYFKPANDTENKITGICKWEQAFRVYTAIYCKVNPTRSTEIWQYVYTINMATASFQWENVAWYDFTFCQLMAAKPYHSWAKTYAQFWNLAMRNPLGSSGGNFGNCNPGVGGGNKQSAGYDGSNGNTKKYGDWRDMCCWHFN